MRMNWKLTIEMRLKKMKKTNQFEDLRGLMLSLGAKEEKLDGFTFLELDCGPGSKTKNEVHKREEKNEKIQSIK